MPRFTLHDGSVNSNAVETNDSAEWILYVLTQISTFAGYEVFDSEAQKYIPVNEFVAEHFNLVPKFYRMKPLTEDILPGGLILQRGMEVLVEDPKERVNIRDMIYDWELDRALERNRWCKIILTTPSVTADHRHIEFYAEYPDGTRRLRVAELGKAWLVKKDSYKEAMYRLDTLREKVGALVHEGMTDVLRMNESDGSGTEKAIRFGQKAQEITGKIVELF